MARHALLERLGIEHPILLAPMAGSGGTPELAAAVSNAGGLGAWGGAYAKPEDIAAAIRSIRQLTDRPFNINLFAGGYAAGHDIDPQPMVDIVATAHAKLGLPAPVLPPVPRDPFKEQLDAVLEERPPVFSFTFGIPTAAQIAALKRRDIAIVGTATTVEEARLLEQAGVDAIVAQGSEAGAHRGSAVRAFDGATRDAGTRDSRQRQATGDRIGRHHERTRYCGRDETGRRGRATRHGVPAVP
jgi:nitronate monooxygenase